MARSFIIQASARARIVFYSTVGPDGCWTWLGKRDRDGYGQIAINSRPKRAHRVAYELLVGPIPTGLVIDHLCRNRACVNPAHLEAVSNEENVNRGLRSGSKSTCVNGHEFTPENTYARTDPGRRKCRKCVAAAQRRYQARKKARAAGIEWVDAA